MAATEYKYSISTDFPNHVVCSDRLTTEVRTSAITVALDRIDTVGDDCSVWFKAVLSVDEETVLDQLVSVHSGAAVVEPPARVMLAAATGQPVGVAENRVITVNFPADYGANLWLTGHGDDAQAGRGEGPRIGARFDDVVREASEIKTIDLRFLEQVQLHDGQFFVKDPQNWDLGDEWSCGLVMPASVVTPNVGNTGNCDLIDVGGYHAIVPAAGTGTHDVDLDVAVPVPQPGGGWDYSVYTDTVSPPTDSLNTAWALFDIPLYPCLQKWVPVPFHPLGVFDFDAYDSQRISPRWILRVTVKKVSSGPGTFAGWIVVFRTNNL